MEVDFTNMSDDEILEYLENLSDDDFEALSEDAKSFLDKFLEENTEDEDEVIDEDTSEDDEESEFEEVEDLEETASSDTLKPGAGSGGTDSKSYVLATFTKLLSDLGKEDLSDLYNKTVDQISHLNDKVPANSEKNKASVNAKPSSAVGSGGAKPADPMPKLNVKEDIEEMFSGDDLSEDFKEKAETVFEAAVSTRIILETEKLNEAYEAKVEALEEEYATKLDEEVDSILSELTDKIDQYINHSVDVFMEENELAIENSLRSEIAEDFITGLKNLFSEHYITVPEEKLDIVSDLQDQVEDLSAKLDEAMDANLELRSLVEEATQTEIFDDVSEGLTKTQVEKLRTLVEGVEFTDTETYYKKLNIIKENYFNKTKTSNETGLIVEGIDGKDDTELKEEVAVNPSMKRYTDALSKIIK